MGKTAAYLSGLVLGAYMALAPNVNAQTKADYDYTIKVKVKNEFYQSKVTEYNVRISKYIFSAITSDDKLKTFFSNKDGQTQYLDVIIDSGDEVELGFKEKKLSKQKFDKTQKIEVKLENIISVNGKKFK